MNWAPAILFALLVYVFTPSVVSGQHHGSLQPPALDSTPSVPLQLVTGGSSRDIVSCKNPNIPLQDSLTVESGTSTCEPSLPLVSLLQLAGGGVAHAIPFWTLSGTPSLRTGDTQMAGMFLGILTTGLTIPFIGNTFGELKGSYGIGLAGSVIGALIAGPLALHVSNHSNSVALQYFAVALPPIICSLLGYHFFLDH